MDTPLYSFDITLHARAEAAVPGPPLADPWGTWPTLAVDRAALATTMAIACDDALENLGRLERLFVEPDGSFVWTSPGEGRLWQVDGNAVERQGRVWTVDVKGTCPPPEFDRLLGALGWPRQPMMMQLVRSAVFLDERTFRRHATRRGGVGLGPSAPPA